MKNKKIDILFRKITGCLLVCLFIGTTQLLAAANAQNVRLNLRFENADLKEVMNEIKKQTELDFVYNSSDLNQYRKLSIQLQNAELENALKACFDKMNLNYTLQDKIIILQKKTENNSPQQQGMTLKGKVTDKNKEVLPGVSVRIKGTSIGVATDQNGKFTITLPTVENCQLIFSFVGMKDKTYQVKNSDQDIVVQLEDDIANLDEVIVTGMETIKKNMMVGSASVVTAKDLKAVGITSIDQALEGMIAGLNSTTLSGAPGTRAQITIRGENNLSGNTEPLWIVDGLPLMSGVPTNNTGDYAGTIMQDGVGNIMPEDIESITILKDASAAAIYGARAANGVIVITTKKGFRSKTQINYNGTYNCAIAPEFNIDFMSTSEKLGFETDVAKLYGTEQAQKAGRGGNAWRKLQRGMMTSDEYQQEMNRLQGINTNWFDVLFRTANSHQHNVSLRGGSEEMTYYTSINFQDKQGILLPNRYSNAGALLKLDYRPIKNLILGVDFSANIRNNKNHASAIDPFRYAVFANTYERPFDENGNYAADLSYLGNNTEETPSGYEYDQFNIIREMTENTQTQSGLDASLTFNARYEVIPGLALETIIRKGVSYNTDMTELEPGGYTSLVNENFAQQVFGNGNLFPSEYNDGRLSEGSGKNLNWSIRNQIDYSFSIAKAHNFSVLVAQEVMSKKYNNFGYTSPIYYSDYRITGVPEFDDKTIRYSDLRGQIAGMFNTSDGQDRTVSFLGSLRYSYNDRYVFNFNCRADGADAIGDGNRFSPLWSVGLRYNLHKEKFFENDIVNELSFRGSYGYTGNIDRTAYPFSTITLGSSLYQGDRYVNGFNYPNPTVRWEKKRDRNLGMDMALLKGRINFTADYYSNRTKDVLETLQVPYSVGRGTVKANGGIVSNEGFEFYLNVKWVNTKDFTFSTSVNMAKNKNVIHKSKDSYKSYQEIIAATNNKNAKGGQINIIGQETGAIYGWKSAGVDPYSGNPMYYLTPEGKVAYAAFLDGWDNFNQSAKDRFIEQGVVTDFTVPDKVTFIKDSDSDRQFFNPSMQFIGRSNPKHVGGFNTYLRYKGIEFSTQWTFKTGHIIPSFSDLKNAPGGGGYANELAIVGTNMQRRNLNFWQGPGDVTNVSRFLNSGNNFWGPVHTTDDYEKGDYLRMTNISLSYRLPSEFTQQFGMQSMSISCNARNLLTFTKYRGLDVGNNGSFTYPAAKEFNVKLSVGF